MSSSKKNFLIRYRNKRWQQGLTQGWYNYHKKMFGALIVRGLKLKAYKDFSTILSLLKKKEKIEPRYLFLIICLRATPKLIVKKIMRGSRSIFKPIPVVKSKVSSLVIKWFIKSLRDAHKRRNASVKKIFDLLIATLWKRGLVQHRKINMYKVARLHRKPKTKFKFSSSFHSKYKSKYKIKNFKKILSPGLKINFKNKDFNSKWFR